MDGDIVSSKKFAMDLDEDLNYEHDDMDVETPEQQPDNAYRDVTRTTEDLGVDALMDTIPPLSYDTGKKILA